MVVERAGGAPEPYGTFSERTLVPQGWAVPTPAGLGDVRAAAVVNPAMSSWLPLAGRAALRPGETVLVLGATGASGSLAVRIALHLGAGRVIAVGRNAEALATLATDERVRTVQLGDDPGAALARACAEGVDVVLDHLWGPVAEMTLNGLRRNGMSGIRRAVRYVQIGALAGREIALDAALLRSSNITIMGSGGGSIDPELLFSQLPHILDLAAEGELAVAVQEIPLARIGAAWASTQRLVATI